MGGTGCCSALIGGTFCYDNDDDDDDDDDGNDDQK